MYLFTICRWLFVYGKQMHIPSQKPELHKFGTKQCNSDATLENIYRCNLGTPEALFICHPPSNTVIAALMPLELSSLFIWP